MSASTILIAILSGLYIEPALPPSPADEARADELLRQGVALRHQGEEERAYALFVQADELAPSPRTKAQRALAAKSLRRFDEAEQLLRVALASNGDPWIEQHRATLDQALAFVIRAKPAPPAPALVARPASPPQPAPALPRLPPPPAAPPHAPPRLWRPSVVITAAVAAAGLAAGSMLGLEALDLKRQRDAVCPDRTCPTEQGVDLDRRGRRVALAADVGFAVGIAGAITATTLVLRARGAAAQPTEPRASIAPLPSGFALSLRL